MAKLSPGAYTVLISGLQVSSSYSGMNGLYALVWELLYMHMYWKGEGSEGYMFLQENFGLLRYLSVRSDLHL